MISRKLAIRYGGPAAVVLVAVLIGIAVYTSSEDDVRLKAEAHLNVARDEAHEALLARLGTVRDAFARARHGAVPFAEDSLSWSARWALLKDTAGVGQSDAHKKFLAESFEKHVFSNAGLKAVLEGAVTGYVSDLRAIESRMLVSLRADVADSALAGRLPDSLRNEVAFRETYDRLTVQLDESLTKESRVFLATNAASWVAADLATPIAMQLLVSAAKDLGVDTDNLSSGAGDLLVTLAVGALVGVIADYIIAAVLKAVGYDPEADVANAVRSSIDAMESAVWGHPGKPGLSDELCRIRDERAAIRQKAILALITDGGAK